MRYWHPQKVSSLQVRQRTAIARCLGLPLLSSHSHSSDWSEDFAVKISMAPIEGVASEDMTWEGILRTIMCFG
jgi:hypothetical protein